MNKREKVQILSNINDFDVDTLAVFISENQISLNEMKSYGLNDQKISELSILQAQQQEKETDKNKTLKICADIEDGKYSAAVIKSMILEDRISRHDLINNTSLDHDLIEKIISYEPPKINFNSWKDLPPLESKRTDVYFFGQPGSGKSCVLASLFYYLEKYGLMQVNLTNQAGALYRAKLKDDFEFGVLPPSTAVDGVNYIALDVRNNEDRNKWHPLNFIEMSGENFNSAFEDGINSSNINQSNYLTNDNRKIIFFVIDYDAHIQGRIGEYSQSSMMVNVLELLDRSGILTQTEAIYILLTKTDLFPQGVDRQDYSREFLLNNYTNFIQNIKDKQYKYRKKNEIDDAVFPYSIGEVKFVDILTSIDQDSPGNIVDIIRENSFVTESKSRLF